MPIYKKVREHYRNGLRLRYEGENRRFIATDGHLLVEVVARTDPKNVSGFRPKEQFIPRPRGQGERVPARENWRHAILIITP